MDSVESRKTYAGRAGWVNPAESAPEFKDRGYEWAYCLLRFSGEPHRPVVEGVILELA